MKPPMQLQTRRQVIQWWKDRGTVIRILYSSGHIRCKILSLAPRQHVILDREAFRFWNLSTLLTSSSGTPILNSSNTHTNAIQKHAPFPGGTAGCGLTFFPTHPGMSDCSQTWVGEELIKLPTAVGAKGHVFPVDTKHWTGPLSMQVKQEVGLKLCNL